jgi:U3 small nucleolar RNA-associated protein 25
MKREHLEDEESGSENVEETFEYDTDDTNSEVDSIDNMDSSKAIALDPFREEEYQKMIEKGFFSETFQRKPITWLSGEQIESCSDTKNSESNWKDKLQTAFQKAVGKELDEENQSFLDGISSHLDVFHFEDSSSFENKSKIYILAASILDRLCRTRDRIIKNNQKRTTDPSCDVRDQGFTRPRILYLCPFRNGAHRLVTAMMELWNSDDQQVEQRRRFLSEYGPDEDEQEIDESRPADYRYCMEGNIDDCFRIGIKLTRKSLKLYADFYSADIIIASPLGLKLVLDGQDALPKQKKEEKGRKKPTKSAMGDSDFLSSIEMFIVNQANVIAMQNWEHLVEVFDSLNKVPRDSHGCDFSRLLSVFLDNRAKEARQSIILSGSPFPEAMALANRCRNVQGWLRVVDPKRKVIKSSCPAFHVLPYTGPDAAEEAESRFKYFTEQLLPSLLSSPQHHILLHCATFFEYLRLKTYLQDTAAVSFASVSEYDDQKSVTRARSRFSDGHVRILLLTERFMFFNRLAIKGVRRLVFYSLPIHIDTHYREWLEMVHVRDGVKVAPIILASKFDAVKIMQLVGRDKMKDLLEL